MQYKFSALWPAATYQPDDTGEPSRRFRASLKYGPGKSTKPEETQETLQRLRDPIQASVGLVGLDNQIHEQSSEV